jgi:hypothetical protein
MLPLYGSVLANLGAWLLGLSRCTRSPYQRLRPHAHAPTLKPVTDRPSLSRARRPISNRESIDVDQDWAGFSASLFKPSEDEFASFSPCHWGTPGKLSECVFPVEQYWYKPLSARDARQSVMAVLLVNNGDTARNLSFAFNEVPGRQAQAATAFTLFDVWAQQTLVGFVALRLRTAPCSSSRSATLNAQ